MRTAGAHYDPSLLPVPSVFFNEQLTKIGRPNHKGWASADCPFHESSGHASLRVNLENGAWHCFGCDAHGDLIKFVRLRYRMSFAEACKYLGAWTEGVNPVVLRELKHRRQHVQQEWKEHIEHERRLRVFATDRLRRLEKLWDDVTGNFRDEDIYYDFLNDLLAEIREAEGEHARWVDRTRNAYGFSAGTGSRQS